MPEKSASIKVAIVLFVILASPFLHGQGVNLNTYYAYPISFGASFENITPYTGEKLDNGGYYGFSGTVRVPFPFAPTFQPFLKLGANLFLAPTASTASTANSNQFQNTQYFAMPGIGWSNRLAKNFELGVDLGVGYEMMVFPSIDLLHTPPVSMRTDNVLASVAARLTFNPSFNLAIDVPPALTYRHAFQPLTQFNGLTFSIGGSLSYRFGEDPDSPKTAIRSISFGEMSFPPLYAAMQSCYASKPFTKLTIKNVESFPISDVQVTFNQPGYMDTPTKLASIASLAPGKTADINVRASFNSEVFFTNGDTPLSGEIVAEYMSHNRAAKQSLPVSYTLFDRTSICWDDDKKEAAFITKADTALRNYATFIRQAVKDRTVPGYSEPLQTAMAVYYSLKELGVIYQLALTSSFAQAQSDPLTVDHVHLPRETLTRRAGDCSDLTALFCAIMESVGIPTGFITVPGHIYPVFGTKVATSSFRDLHPDKNMTFDVNGELWIPVEMTMVGTSDFPSAWRKGVEEWKALDNEAKDRAIFFTADCQNTYKPVGLKEQDLGLQYGDTKKIADNFRDSADKIVDTVIGSYMKVANDSNAKSDYNKVGIVAAQYGRYDQALKALNTALALDRNYLGAQINLGNVYFLQQDYQDALRVFHQVEQGMGAGATSSLYARVLLNISRAYYELENYDQAGAYYDKASAVDPNLTSSYGYLKSGQGSSGARAAAQGSGPQILYAEGEE